MNHMFVSESFDNFHLQVYDRAATEASQVLHPIQRRSGTVQEARKLFFLLCEDGNPRHDDKVLLLIDGFWIKHIMFTCLQEPNIIVDYATVAQFCRWRHISGRLGKTSY